MAYSIKANYNPSVIKTFVSEGIMFDLTASNELYFLLKCGGSPENVIYTSITETMAEYEQVMKLGVRKIVVSSYNGLLNLIEARTRVGEEVEVLIRVNPEVSVKAELRFSIKHGKFGVPLDSADEDSAMSLLRKILSTPGMNFEGFHFHLGSQIEDPSCFAVALEKLESFILGARRELGDFPSQDDRHRRRHPCAVREERPERVGLLRAGPGAAEQHDREPGRQVHADRREREVPLGGVDHHGLADRQRQEVRRDEVRLPRRGLSQPARLGAAEARVSRRGHPGRDLLAAQDGPLGQALRRARHLPRRRAGRSSEARSQASSWCSGTSAPTRSS